MIRITCLLLFLSASTIVLAQPLYKWVEPDGAITFSPTKPPAGVSFEIVNGADAASSQPASAAAKATVTKAASTPAPRIRASEQSIVRTEVPRLKMTPAPDKAQQSQTSDAVSAVTAMTSGNSTLQGANSDGFRSVSESSAMRKQQQCQDLQKRVLSLERRLKSRLTPEDMDNTVIHMARYQRSYDQHCVQ